MSERSFPELSVSERLNVLGERSAREVRESIEDLDHGHSGYPDEDVLGNLKTIARLEDIGPHHHDQLNLLAESAMREGIREEQALTKSLSDASQDIGVREAIREIESIRQSESDISIGIELEMPAHEGFMNEDDVAALNIPSEYGDMVVMESGPNTAEIRTDVHRGPLAAVESVFDTYELIRDNTNYSFEETSIPMNNPMDTGLGIDVVQSQFPGLHVHIGAEPGEKERIAEGVMNYGRELAFLSTGFESSNYDPDDNSLSLRQLRTKGGGGMKGQVTSREDLDTLEYRMFDVATDKEKMLPIVGALAGLHTYYQDISGDNPEVDSEWTSTADGPSLSLSGEKWKEYRDVLENKEAAGRFLDYGSMRDKIEQGLDHLGVDTEVYLEEIDNLYMERSLSVRYWEEPTETSISPGDFGVSD